jgi:plasmid stabilization system protein ParE
MKPVVYHQAAEVEFAAAVRWCEAEPSGRGLRLDALVEKAERQIQLHPASGRRYIRGARRLVLTRFPYSLIYLIQADRCYVVAFAHAKRRPGYWKDRL